MSFESRGGVVELECRGQHAYVSFASRRVDVTLLRLILSLLIPQMSCTVADHLALS